MVYEAFSWALNEIFAVFINKQLHVNKLIVGSRDIVCHFGSDVPINIKLKEKGASLPWSDPIHWKPFYCILAHMIRL